MTKRPQKSDKTIASLHTWGITEIQLFNLSLFLGTILFSVLIWNVPILANALTGGGASAGGLSIAKGMASGSAEAGAWGIRGAKAGGGALWNKIRGSSIKAN